MNGIPMEHGLMLAAILFALGLAGLMLRRSMLFILMSLEIMLNAAGLAFIVGSTAWNQPDGQAMFLLVITLAAAEASVGLALMIQLYQRFHSLKLDNVSRMRG
ncbi:NADH-quinone oxidoreductase subunit NuoK [Halovibrio sp. HP20-50]|uniref:NADH-quinone oxidoreductase subunit NuoK n=1 Tax=Halovibrio sp. HP20-59 TaxID=3080275 RepID=UPI00294B5E17|nr:NADH-quinone oxidoreductase subunit NuoK [Halovibrio sp. HP20-59]MEA2118958.1 NADH-quinone oxidoreductase subunit NuoK [Halovibrio sp. HP20-59]